MDKTWVKCFLCVGIGEITQLIPGSDQTEVVTCPRCNGEKVEFTSIIEGTAEDARGMFGLSEPE